MVKKNLIPMTFMAMILAANPASATPLPPPNKPIMASETACSQYVQNRIMSEYPNLQEVFSPEFQNNLPKPMSAIGTVLEYLSVYKSAYENGETNGQSGSSNSSQNLCSSEANVIINNQFPNLSEIMQSSSGMNNNQFINFLLRDLSESRDKVKFLEDQNRRQEMQIHNLELQLANTFTQVTASCDCINAGQKTYGTGSNKGLAIQAAQKACKALQTHTVVIPENCKVE